MAEIGVEPVAVNPRLARRALDAHLARRDDGDPVLTLVEDLVVHMPLVATRPDGGTDDFLLRLAFSHYDEWPPSAQFVNPTTGTFVRGFDDKHVPRIEGSNEVYTHLAYQADPNGTPIQLICSSATLEFYLVKHSVDLKHLWHQGKDTLWKTVHAIDRHLRQPWYKGRFA